MIKTTFEDRCNILYNDVHYRRSIQMDVSYQNSHPTSVIPAPDQTGAQATSLYVGVEYLSTSSIQSHSAMCTTTYGLMLYPNS